MPYDIRSSMRLYAVTDSAWLNGRPLSACVDEALRGGATFVQLREKGASTDELVDLAASLIPLCREAGVPFVVNDDVEAARLSGADGVHVGQSDAACREARRILGPEAIVGVSVQTVEQALAAQDSGASYLGVGAMIATSTKTDAVIVSSDELRAICEAVSVPVVAIGGLNESTFGCLAGTGVDGAAVVSAVFAADDIEVATRALLGAIDGVLPIVSEEDHPMESVLTIAGSDSSGGAGIQADIKTIAAHHLFAQSAITALTAQNTTGVYGVFDVPHEFVAQQIDVVFEDIRPDAVKIGMVSSPQIIDAIASSLERNHAENIVVDPVMVATSGSALIADAAVDALVERLFPLASVVTPNIPEAQVLCGFSIESAQDMERAADAIAQAVAERGAKVPAVLVKGGHGIGESDAADDLLRLPDGTMSWLRGKRIENPNSHGTGCSLSSAIACGLARGEGVEQAVRSAKAYVAGALAAGLDLGAGSGPLDHMWAYA